MPYPYYYPYFSARNVETSSISKLQSEISALRRSSMVHEHAQIQLALIKKQQQLNNMRIRQYEEELRAKQNLNDLWEQEQIKAEVDASKQRQHAYQQELNKIKHQQHLRNLNKLNTQRSRLQKQKTATQGYTDRNSKSQDERINQRVIQQYQQELLRKLQSNKQNLAKNQNQAGKPHNGFNTDRKQHMKDIFKKDQAHEQLTTKKHRGKSISFSNPVIMNQINKSTINEGQQSKKFSTLDANRQSKLKGKYPLKESYNKGYYSSREVNKNKSLIRNSKNPFKKSKYFNRSKSRRAKNKSESKVFLNQSLHSRGLRKIANRLKLAAIVFRDAKCKNEKHEIEHLFNTYEGEMRVRKEIKDKLNNHPKILQKHNLVVSSR